MSLVIALIVQSVLVYRIVLWRVSGATSLSKRDEGQSGNNKPYSYEADGSRGYAPEYSPAHSNVSSWRCVALNIASNLKASTSRNPSGSSSAGYHATAAAIFAAVVFCVLNWLLNGFVGGEEQSGSIANDALLSGDASGNISGTIIASSSASLSSHWFASYLPYALVILIVAAFYRLPYPYSWNAKKAVEGGSLHALRGFSLIATITTLAIFASLILESLRFFELVPLSEFLFGTKWSPGSALGAEEVAASGSFGVIPLITGTLLITAVAMSVAVPVGLAAAIYTAELASSKVRAYARPALELLAGVPTVVFGFFAALVLAPFLTQIGDTLGLDVALESALAAGIMMGIMIIPYVSSLTDDAIAAVPRSLRDAAFALGATRYETIVHVVLPAAIPGIAGGIILAVSRAIGETMIVVMAAGLAANLTINPFEAVTTFTVQIVTSLVGDQEFDSARTLSAFALGSFLFVVTFCLNLWALRIVRRYKLSYG